MFKRLFQSFFGSRNERLLRGYEKKVQIINKLSAAMAEMSDADLAGSTERLRARLADGETLDDLLPDAFAVVREVSSRTMGLRHFDVQLIGGMVLHYGKIAEMRTGEGKTLTATLAAYLNALTGDSVHMVTVNDYLAQRDADWMRPIYDFLGLTVGVNLPNMDPEAKRAVYECDIVFGTNNEFGFDYLRDNMAYTLEQRVQRKLAFAVVDEVDSILIDEARTPLIISGQAEESSNLYTEVDAIIPQLIKQETEDGPGDYTVDEKNRQVFLTDSGHERVEKLMRAKDLLQGEGGLYDLSNITLMHYVNAALRAHTLYQRDVDYIVKDDQVIIVDEHTGRLMEGRRWSEGLHQATEAKEKVKIQLENQTLATITFQNFFRLYEKLSGMTGTADTEAFEFQKIYALEVVVIPTHRPMARIDKPDRVYLNIKAKYKAILEDLRERNAKGQPVLVGTTSIESSELISQLLKKDNIEHKVLNAKHHEQEAGIIAQAGRPGAIVIATNMAGRGTDIVLGGNLQVELDSNPDASPEQIEAIKKDWQQRHELVKQSGGLHLLGTERNESRRIDNQLRGRSGRQGDPGSSQFYLALDDNLLRIFAAGMITNLVKRLGFTENDVIEHTMLSRSIEKAQRRVEGMNFDIRKQLLEYDDVASDQRKVIYAQRLRLLESDSIDSSIERLIDEVAVKLVAQYIPENSMAVEWDIAGLEQSLSQDFALEVDVQSWLDSEADIKTEQIIQRVTDAIRQRIADKREEFGEETMQQMQKQIMLQVLDQHWKDHLAAMDHLRQSIHLRGYAQKNPAQEYKRECFEMFTQLMQALKAEVIGMLARVQLASEEELKQQHAMDTNLSYKHHELGQITSPEQAAEVMEEEGTLPASQNVVASGPKVGRNEPCPCGSGKKYKQCHGKLT